MVLGLTGEGISTAAERIGEPAAGRPDGGRCRGECPPAVRVRLDDLEATLEVVEQVAQHPEGVLRSAQHWREERRACPRPAGSSRLHDRRQVIHGPRRRAVHCGLVADFADRRLQGLDFVGQRPRGGAEVTVLQVEPVGSRAQVADFRQRAPAQAQADEDGQRKKQPEPGDQQKRTNPQTPVRARAAIRNYDRIATCVTH